MRNPSMAVMPLETGYLIPISNVQPGFMDVNWAFEPHVHRPGPDHGHGHKHYDEDDISIQVYKGLAVSAPAQQQGLDEQVRVLIEPGRITREIRPRDNTLVARAHAHAHHGDSLLKLLLAKLFKCLG